MILAVVCLSCLCVFVCVVVSGVFGLGCLLYLSFWLLLVQMATL